MDSRQYLHPPPPIPPPLPHPHNNQHPPATNSQQAPIPPLIPQQPTKKRRTSATGTGSRGVANLNPEQLAKKRANDREAQRAIRERTKGQIEGLERKIDELTAQKPYQELQHVIRQKELVEAENEEIKRRLLSIQGLIQPLLGPICSNGTTPPLSNHAAGAPSIYTTGEAGTTLPQTNATAVPTYSDATSVRSTASSGPNYATPPSMQMQTPPVHQSNFSPQQAPFSPVNNFTPRQSGGRLPRDDKLALDYLMASRHNSRDSQQSVGGDPRGRTTSASSHALLPMETLTPPGRSPNLNGLDAQGNALPACAVPVKNIPPTCPLDGLLLDFLAGRRKQALEGVPSAELVGPPYPSFMSLVYPQRNIYSHPLSKMFTDMMATFPDISTLPEQVAILYVMFLQMRYQIHPSPTNADRLPDWITPRPSQLFVPHPAWIDYLPWPRMRDKLVQTYPSTPFDEFFVPYTTTVSVNWPWDDKGVLVSVGGGTGGQEEYIITEEFEQHLRELGNWSLGERFAQAHPGLAETARIKEDEPGSGG